MSNLPHCLIRFHGLLFGHRDQTDIFLGRSTPVFGVELHSVTGLNELRVMKVVCCGVIQTFDVHNIRAHLDFILEKPLQKLPTPRTILMLHLNMWILSRAI